jgi:peptidoglycan hydrolase-like protein with peptidoglycan-binding domain
MNTSPIARRATRGTRNLALVAAVVTVALFAAACGSDDDDSGATDVSSAPADPVAAAQDRVTAAEAGVTTANDSLTAAASQACSDATNYVEILDRYGKLFTDDAATVGDVNTLGADLVEPRETVAASAAAVAPARDAVAAADQELVDAQAALADAIAIASSLPTSTTTPASTTTTTLVPAATIDRVQQAEDDLAKAGAGITDATPLAEATAEYNSAAFALQIAWMRLLSDGGCLSDEQQANAVAQVTAYTATLQTQLQQIGLYAGEIDGIYGPQTTAAVKQLQKDSGLRETGYVDQSTANALDAKLAELGQQAATVELTNIASLQTVLTLTGFWTGPIDGVWSDELTAALQAFQTELGVPPTGEVDAATLAAFQQALAAITGLVTATTTLVPDTVAPPVVTEAPPAPPTEAPVPPTETSTAP